MAENTINETLNIEERPSLGKSISFAVYFTAKRCNPNGDPLAGNQARQDPLTFKGYVTAECIKNKLRKRLMWTQQPVLVQPDSHPYRDTYSCVNNRAKAVLTGDTYKDIMAQAKAADKAAEKTAEKGDKKAKEVTCGVQTRKAILSKEFTDVRMFGCTIAESGMPTSVIGPITMGSAYSIDVVRPIPYQLTKSTNGTEPKKGKTTGTDDAGDTAEAAADAKSSDTMGFRERIDFGLYELVGGVTPETARATGLTYEDMELFKQALIHLFDGDETTARPAGSMEVCKIVWWESEGMEGMSTAKLARTIHVEKKPGIEDPHSYADYKFTFFDVDGKPEVDQNVCTLPGEKREIIELY